MALLPLLWLGTLAYYGQYRSALWWMLAIVLGVSWLADTAAHWVEPWQVSAVYPIVQALLVAIVLLPNPALARFTALVCAATAVPWLWRGVGHPDVVSHTVAWAGLVTLCWPHRTLRIPILVTFGVGWLGWLAYSIAPGWWTWGAYQAIRAAGLMSFCWATAPQRVRA